jgi:hypothetical protein
VLQWVAVINTPPTPTEVCLLLQDLAQSCLRGGGDGGVCEGGVCVGGGAWTTWQHRDLQCCCAPAGARWRPSAVRLRRSRAWYSMSTKARPGAGECGCEARVRMCGVCVCVCVCVRARARVRPCIDLVHTHATYIEPKPALNLN